MFKLLRYFSVTSLVALVIVAILLGMLYRHVALKGLRQMAESKNVALTQAFSNSLWGEFSPFVRSASGLSGDELRSHPVTARLHEAVRVQMEDLLVVKVKIYNLHGLTVYSTEAGQIGEDQGANPGFLAARMGEVASSLVQRGEIYTFEGVTADRHLLTTYLPIRGGNHTSPIEGVIELYSDVTPLIAEIKAVQVWVVAGVLGILALLYVYLFFIVRRADGIIRRQDLERKRVEENLAAQAIRDSLTGLYNRYYFDHRIRDEISRADRNRQIFAVLLCDLDHFKAINDSRGHQVGDEVLRTVSKAIQASTRGSDLVFRWGGDEFVVVLPEVTREGILVAADRIRKGIRAVGEEARCELDMSIGVALYPEHGTNVDQIIRLADRALYIAKKGGDKIHIGEEEYQLDEHSIKVVFQPVVDVRSDQILGYEALSRDPQDKLSILDLFKRYQAIGQLTELKCICFRVQLKEARAAGLERVFINVDFEVLSQLERIPKPPEMEVILEISEREALRDVENHLRIAREWRELGYKFAIDDFGAGFISLPFIAQLVPDHIKVDRSTVLQAVSSAEFRGFLKDLVLALRNYSKEEIIAEGTETAMELQVVKGMGIHMVQGFLLGKPQEIKTSRKN